LQHERKAPHSRDYLPPSGSFRIGQVYGELVVNAYGVPLELRYVSQRYVLDVGEEVFEVVYEFEGKRYKKKVRVDGGDWDLKVDITEHPGLDLKIPEGLFVAAPSSIACLEWAIVGEANAEACNELNIDPTFANPGFLSLLVPALWEAGRPVATASSFSSRQHAPIWPPARVAASRSTSCRSCLEFPVPRHSPAEFLVSIGADS